jgi:hypothetical protein
MADVDSMVLLARHLASRGRRRVEEGGVSGAGAAERRGGRGGGDGEEEEKEAAKMLLEALKRGADPSCVDLKWLERAAKRERQRKHGSRC